MMKYLAFLIYLSLLTINAFGQSYNMSNTTITTCGGTFYDSGGPSSSYGYNQDLMMTFCPGTAGAFLSFNFTTFNIESDYDFLEVYSGTGTSGTLLYYGTGTQLQGQTIQSSAGGQCITFVFTSDYAVNNAGWAATITCNFACQNFSANIINSSIPYSSGDTIDVCQSQPITFTAAGTYPNNNVNYAQSDATTIFHWDFGDGTTANGITATHTYANSGGYYVTLSADDVNGCDNTNYELNMVRVSTDPIFSGTYIDQDTICLGESVNLFGAVTTNPWEQTVPTEVAGTTFLPDDANGHYNTSITHTIFNPGQTLTNISDLLSICVNMEHSYMGDLTITLSCPSGQTVTMIDFSSNTCGGTYLGVPIDNDANLNPGTGYDYCWTPTATNGSWNDECGSGTLPAGNYQTDSPISTLVGCVLNGDWTIDIFDNLSSDNGYIFSWELHFNPNIIPNNLWTFSNSYPTSGMSWSGNGITSSNYNTASATPTVTGNVGYTFQVTDDFGCTYDTIVYVYVNPAGSPGCCALPTPNAGTDDAICGLTYNLNATPSVGTGAWSLGSGPGTANFTNTSSATSAVTVSTFGDYFFIWTEQNGYSCVNKDTVKITFYDNPTSTFGVSQILCYGDRATITYTGNAATTATYNWNFNGGNIDSGSGQGPYEVWWSPGDYTISLSLIQNGCYSDTTTYSLTYPELLTKPNTILTHNNCNSECSGICILTFQGGTYPFSYTWSPAGTAPTTDSIATNLCAGDYDVTIYDVNGCNQITDFTIQEPTPIVVSTQNINDAHCNQSDGTASVSAQGGTVTSGYTYEWENGTTPTTTTTTGLPEGFTNVTVTDNNGCQEVGMVNIGNLAGVVCDITASDSTTCYGVCNGSATVTMTANGTPSFTYIWSNGQSTSNSSVTNTVTGLCAGFYTVTLIDAVNCKSADSVTIHQPQLLTATITNSTNASCFNYTDGTAIVQGAGGTLPYNYMWSTTDMTASVSGLGAGIYTVTISDVNMCMANTAVTITEPQQLTAVISAHTNTSCNGTCDGTATVTANYGTPPYNLIWTNGSPNASVSALCAGKQTVTVTDSHSCTTTADVTITEPALLSVQITSTTDATCKNYCDGTATASASGGTASYNYVWDNGNIGSNGTQLCAGSHTVTVTDSHNCIFISNLTIGEPTQLTAVISNKVMPTCFGKCDGKAKVTASGGISPYSYSWPTGSYADTTENLCAGEITVNVYDSNNCQVTATSQLGQPAPLKINASPLNSNICKGQSIELTASYVSGGTLPITYIWTLPNGSSSNLPTITDNPTISSTYLIKAVDANGCYSINQFAPFVNVYPDIILDVFTNKTSICPGDTIKIKANTTGGNNGPYSLSVNDEGYYTPPFELIPEGVDTTIWYVFTASDFCGSPVGKDSLQITLKPIPPNNFSSDTTSGCQPLTVNFNEGSLHAGQTYYWDFGDENYNNYSGNSTVQHIYEDYGVYDVTLTVKGSNGCTNTQTREDMINVFPKPDAKFLVDPLSASIIKADFYFENLSTYNYLSFWDFGDGYISNEKNPHHEYYETGVFDVELVIMSDLGCLDTTYYNVIVKDEFTFYAPDAFTPDDDGINDIFYVFGEGINTEYFHFYIFDRWGEIIFYTNQYDPKNRKEFGWDGKVNGEAKASTGVYTWYIDYKDKNGVEHQKSGSVTLLR